MSDAILKRFRADKLPECSFDGGATWEIDGVAVAEMLEEAAREIERLQDRLEMRHAYDIDGNKIAIEPGAIPDGIESRDDTIKMQAAAIDALREDAGRLRRQYKRDVVDICDTARQNLDEALKQRQRADALQAEVAAAHRQALEEVAERLEAAAEECGTHYGAGLPRRELLSEVAAIRAKIGEDG